MSKRKDEDYEYKLVRTKEDELRDEIRIMRRVISEMSRIVTKCGYDPDKILQRIINKED